MPYAWTLIQQECTGCGICADVCPHDAIHMTRTMAYPEAVVGQCVGCRECVAQCPFAAVEVHLLSGSREQQDLYAHKP